MTRAMKLGFKERLSVMLRRCPRCGTRLELREALEEAYTRKVAVSMDLGTTKGSWGPRQVMFEEVAVTPRYWVCPSCGFRIRHRKI